MCQLLGMNCAAPTDCSFSFKGFCQRGGGTDIHSHGFGLVSGLKGTKTESIPSLWFATTASVFQKSFLIQTCCHCRWEMIHQTTPSNTTTSKFEWFSLAQLRCCHFVLCVTMLIIGSPFLHSGNALSLFVSLQKGWKTALV